MKQKLLKRMKRIFDAVMPKAEPVRSKSKPRQQKPIDRAELVKQQIEAVIGPQPRIAWSARRKRLFQMEKIRRRVLNEMRRPRHWFRSAKGKLYDEE